MVEAQVAASERRLLVDRIARSECFCKSPRLREFFSYVADCTLTDRVQETREQVIAERVFGRKPELNSGGDSIVRTEARNLRKRLELYFESEGKNEPLIVSMPKGGYVLDFQSRAIVTPAEDEAQPVRTELAYGETAREVPPASIISSAVLFRYRSLCFVLIAAVVITSVLAWQWRSESSHLRESLGSEPSSLPFSALFGHNQSALIVTSDTGLMQISSLAGRRITLNEYMARSYPDIKGTQPPDLVNRWNVFEFTDGREMALAGLFLQKNIRRLQQISLLSGHQVQLEDFENHSAILIGSPVSNPWAQLFEDKLNFSCDLLRDGRIVFSNRSAKKGESLEYPTTADSDQGRSFARIAFLPGTNGGPPVLLIAGTTAQLTKVAGEFVSETPRFDKALRDMGVDPSGAPRFFEVLIRSNTFVSGAILPEIVAYRTRAYRR